MTAAAMTTERALYEILCAAPMTEAEALLAQVFDLAPGEVAPLYAGAGEPALRYELVELPGSFPAKLSVYARPELGRGPSSDLELARSVAERLGAPTLAGLPEAHPEASNPYAWLRFSPGRDPELVHERPSDDDGVVLAR